MVQDNTNPSKEWSGAALTQVRNSVGGLRHFVRDHEHEDSEGEEHSDAEGNLLSCIWRGQEH